jgi:phosphopantothenate synthetase
MPALVEKAKKLKKENREKLDHIRASFNNYENLGESLKLINQRLRQLAETNQLSTA